MLKINVLQLIVIFLFITAISILLVKNAPIVIVPTSSLPVANHTIVLDAGHGLPDGGAVSKNGISEEQINLQIVLKLQELLESSGCNVVLTRSDENGIYDANAKSKKASDLKNRIDIINSSGADCLVSIHLNKIPQQQYYGWQSFYQKDNDESKALAKSIQSSLNYSTGIDNKRQSLPISNIYLMDNSNIPSTLIECGFLSNKAECAMLQDDEYQNKLTWGIYTGIMDFLN